MAGAYTTRKMTNDQKHTRAYLLSALVVAVLLAVALVVGWWKGF
jgi:hypothetical protein